MSVDAGKETTGLAVYPALMTAYEGVGVCVGGIVYSRNTF